MHVLDAIVKAQNGSVVRQVATCLGLGEQQTAQALSAVMPALADAFHRNLQTADGVESLISALRTGRHQRHFSIPASLGSPGAVVDGNGILAHLFGSKSISRAVASHAAVKTQLPSGALKQLLPLAAALMMAAFAQRINLSHTTGASGAIVEMLTPLLEHACNGSMVEGAAPPVDRFHVKA